MTIARSALDTKTTIPGTMMDVPLTLTWIFEHALRNHGAQTIVSRLDDGSIFRYTYADFGKRVAQLANALVELGVKPGDRVASFAWNSHRHLELYYAVPMIGAVLHTANIRLFPEQVCWALNHAEDKFVFVDSSLAPAFARALAVQPKPAWRAVVMGSASVDVPDALDYETLLAGAPTSFAWPELDERVACILCYTSATTGEPKGVLFTHRSTILHAYASLPGDALDLRQADSLLPIVPMFHVNAWGLPFAAVMVGAKIVMPGAKMDPDSLIELMNLERVTISAGVPTVWIAVRDELKRRNTRVTTLQRLVIGGSACPPSLLDDLNAMGVDVLHAWGMTEMSPIGTVSHLHSALKDAPVERQREARLKQGTFVPLVAWKLLGEDGEPVAADGKSRGELWVRGPAVTASYYRMEPANHPAFHDGWFHTGDICTVDEYGYLQLVDRSKDLVKSGGEWISSVDLENLLMGHPAIKEAAVIGVPHPKWQERPVAVVVLRAPGSLDEPAIQAWLGERVVKWMIPDKVVFIDAIPRTGVGKFLKRDLRDRYKGLLGGP